MNIEIKDFDDELRTMEELMEKQEIALTDESLKVPLSTLNLKKVVVAHAGMPLKECIETMLARSFGCLIVVKDEKYCGIFTERDVLLKIADQKLNLEQEIIDNYMSRDPISLKMSDSIETALRFMVDRGYRHICITDEKESPLSVISIKDLVSFIVEFFPQDILNLPPHPIRVGTKHRYGG